MLSLDPRIGPGHLRAGFGFGGSCLPKDVAAVEHLARRYGANPDLFAAVQRVNRDQRTRVIDLLVARFGSVAKRRLAILGMAFKAGTDDTRESAVAALAEQLLALRSDVVYYDPVVRVELRNGDTRAMLALSALAAARGADAVVFATDWPELASLDLAALRRVMRGMCRSTAGASSRRRRRGRWVSTTLASAAAAGRSAQRGRSTQPPERNSAILSAM